MAAQTFKGMIKNYDFFTQSTCILLSEKTLRAQRGPSCPAETFQHSVITRLQRREREGENKEEKPQR